jgi:hypothetical protein
MKPNTDTNTMTSTSKPTTSPLRQICGSYEKTLADAAAADAAVATAQEEYDIAKIDDGKTDPGAIYDRKTAAERKLFIREAEAKRASMKLEEATAEFETSIERLAAPLLEELAKIRDSNAERLTKELATKLPKDNDAAHALNNFVIRCDGVVEFSLAISVIHEGLARLPIHGPKSGGLIKALAAADRLL